MNILIGRQFHGSVNAARQQLVRSPRRSLWSGPQTLYGISPHLLPPAELPASLDAGRPPVFLDCGSMTGLDRECVLLALLKALAPSRILLFPSWAGLLAMSFPDSVFVHSSTRSAVLALRTGHPP